jgi:hypothetical protein
VGDSGNARGGPPHCHFELTSGYRYLNPTPSLRAARRVKQPVVPSVQPALKPEKGEIRLDGAVRTFSGGTTLVVRVLSTSDDKGHVHPEAHPVKRWVTLRNDTLLRRRDAPDQPITAVDLTPGLPIIVIGRDKGKDHALPARLAAVDPAPVYARNRRTDMPSFITPFDRPAIPADSYMPPYVMVSGNPKWSELTAVLIAGGENRNDQDETYTANVNNLAPYARLFHDQGVRVLEFGRNNSDPAAIARAVHEASFIVYSGQPDRERGGLAIAGSSNGSRTVLTPDILQRTWQPLPGALMIYAGPCGASGSATAERSVTQETAARRVTAFSTPFLQMGCAFLADWEGAGILQEMFRGKSISEAYRKATGKDSLIQNSLDGGRTQLIAQEHLGAITTWRHAFCGDPNLTLEKMAAAVAQPADRSESPTVWKALALVYPRLDVRLPQGAGGAHVQMGMTQEQLDSAIHELQVWPRYMERVTHGLCHVDLTIQIVRHPLSALSAVTPGQGARPTPADTQPDLAALKAEGKFDTVMTVWFAAGGLLRVAPASVDVSSGAIWTDTALGSDPLPNAGAGLPDVSNLFVKRWLQGVTAYARQRGFGVAAYSDAAQAGYAADSENWVRALVGSSMPAKTGSRGLGAAFWRSGTPLQPAAILPVQLLSPPNNSTWERIPTLKWVASNADSYRVEIYDPAAPDRPIYTAVTHDAFLALPDDRIPFGQMVSWQVIAQHNGVSAPPGDRFNLIHDHPTRPALINLTARPSNLPWSGGRLDLSLEVKGHGSVSSLHAETTLWDGRTVSCDLQAGRAALWTGQLEIPANRTGRAAAAHVVVTSIDEQGNRTEGPTLEVSIPPRSPAAGPRLWPVGNWDPARPVRGTLGFRADADRYAQAGGTEYAFTVDGAIVARFRRAPFSYNWDSTTVADGRHLVSILKIDPVDDTRTVADLLEVTVQNGDAGGR